ncbi:MAG: integrase domain-containing protein [Deltaproteobacteria bacterium]|nr:integrase domain-containing protein [Deltaproteobacteria bacterium]
MTKIEYKINHELKQIEHFHKVDNPVSVVSNKRDHDIRQDLRRIAHDARNFGIGVTANRKGDIGKWTNADIKQIVNHYKTAGLTDATIINYVSSLRSFLFETKRTNITASNSEVGLKRVIEYKDKSLGAKGIDLNEKLAYFKEKDANVYVQLKISSIVGLRKEESVHAALALAKGYDIVKDNKLILKGSWCKNGRPREIKLSQEKVREFAELKKFAISSDYNKSRDLKQEMNHLGNSIKNAGFNMHAVRHSEAQERYAELISSGSTEKEAKTAVSQELGHNRDYITKVYLGGK